MSDQFCPERGLREVLTVARCGQVQVFRGEGLGASEYRYLEERD